MQNLKAFLETFTATNDLNKLTTTISAMAIRDCKANPDLYNETDIEIDIIEICSLLGKMQTELHRIEMEELKSSLKSCNTNASAT